MAPWRRNGSSTRWASPGRAVPGRRRTARFERLVYAALEEAFADSLQERRKEQRDEALCSFRPVHLFAHCVLPERGNSASSLWHYTIQPIILRRR